MHLKTKQIGSGGEVLGTLDFPVFDNVAELISTFGEDSTYKLAQRALTIDVERIARDMLKAGKSEAEVQAAIDGYKPGGARTSKPTLKNLMARMQVLGAKATEDASVLESFVKVGKIYTEDGVEAAIAYLDESGN
jgi:hypothetical protein